MRPALPAKSRPLVVRRIQSKCECPGVNATFCRTFDVVVGFSPAAPSGWASVLSRRPRLRWKRRVGGDGRHFDACTHISKKKKKFQIRPIEMILFNFTNLFVPVLLFLVAIATAQQSTASSPASPGNQTTLVSDADRLQANKNREALTKLPRYQLFSSGFSLEPAPKRFCGAEEGSNKCNWAVYAESVLLIGALALVAAGLALIICPVFWALRCCGCCGGLKKTHGFICPGEERSLDERTHCGPCGWCAVAL
jgi:hypothetical protein